MICFQYITFLFLGLLCDLLWSDPDKEVTGWGENDRGVSFTFGPDVVSKFLQKHDLDLICRAHQVCEPTAPVPQVYGGGGGQLPSLVRNINQSGNFYL